MHYMINASNGIKFTFGVIFSVFCLLMNYYLYTVALFTGNADQTVIPCLKNVKR